MREEMDQLFGDGLGATVVTTVASRAEGAQKFGIDITKPAFWESSLDVIRAQIDEYEKAVQS